MKTRVIIMNEQGAPSVMQEQTVELRSPGPGEVQLRQTAIGLNYMDVYQRSGYYPMATPTGLGLEGAGVIEAIGEGVTDFKPGDRAAYGGAAPGGYAESRNIAANRLVAIPDGISDEQAAAVMLKGMTAEYLLNRTYPVKPGEDVLFWAAAGGVGLLAGQWGKAIGARMIGIAGGPEKCALARAHGYADVIDRNAEDVVARVKELTGGAGVPVVYDSIGKSTFMDSLDCLRPEGVMTTFGNATGTVEPFPMGILAAKGSLYVTRPTLATHTATRERLEECAAALMGVVESGQVKVTINQTYALEDAAKAHIDLEARKTSGSSVLLP